MTEDEFVYDLFDDEKLPYKQLSVHDEENAEIKDSINLSCVAFIDILGFKEMVKKDIDKVILALRYIKLFRESYCRLPSKGYVGELQNFLPEATMFSDSIVLSHTIDFDFDFYAFVTALAELQITLLREGITVRGGVEIGNLYHDDCFVFGDGLVSAYLLEKDTAKYPRIVVGEKLFAEVERQFDKGLERRFENKGVSKNWRDYENIALSFISTDRDGVKYINYFRYGFSELNTFDMKNVFWDEQIDSAERFYSDTVKPIAEIIKSKLATEKDEGVMEKYMWLKTAFNEMLNIYINRSHGGKSARYKRLWADRFIE